MASALPQARSFAGVHRSHVSMPMRPSPSGSVRFQYFAHFRAPSSAWFGRLGSEHFFPSLARRGRFDGQVRLPDRSLTRNTIARGGHGTLKGDRSRSTKLGRAVQSPPVPSVSGATEYFATEPERSVPLEHRGHFVVRGWATLVGHHPHLTSHSPGQDGNRYISREKLLQQFRTKSATARRKGRGVLSRCPPRRCECAPGQAYKATCSASNRGVHETQPSCPRLLQLAQPALPRCARRECRLH